MGLFWIRIFELGIARLCPSFLQYVAISHFYFNNFLACLIFFLCLCQMLMWGCFSLPFVAYSALVSIGPWALVCFDVTCIAIFPHSTSFSVIAWFLMVGALSAFTLIAVACERLF